MMPYSLASVRGQHEVAVGVLADPLDVWPRVAGQDLGRAGPASAGSRWAWISMSVAWPPPCPHGWWSSTRACGQGQALARRARGQQHRRRRGRLPEADRRDVGLDVLHRVVDREQRGDVAARAVDVDVDVLVGVLRLEVQQLGADQVGDRVVDRRAQEDDVVLEQPRVEVEGPLAPVGLLDHRGHQVVVGGLDGHSSSVSSDGRRLRRPRRACCRSWPRPRPSAPLDRRVLPRSSTTSTCSSSQSRALRFLMSERTNGIWSLRSNCLRTCSALLAHPLGDGGELLLEVVVGRPRCPRPRPRPAGRGRP